MAESNSTNIEDQDDELVKKLPSIPSSDEVAFYEDNVAPVHERKGSIDERLHRLRAVTQGVIAARKFRRSSSIQGKYVAITPNERDNLEHIQHMTEDITARLDKLRDHDHDTDSTAESGKEALPQPHGDLYVPTAVQGKFVQFIPFDATRPSSLHPPAVSETEPRSDISPLPPPLAPVDSFAFVDGDVDDMEGDAASDDAEGAFHTASLERRLRQLSERRTQ